MAFEGRTVALALAWCAFLLTGERGEIGFAGIRH